MDLTALTQAPNRLFSFGSKYGDALGPGHRIGKQDFNRPLGEPGLDSDVLQLFDRDDPRTGHLVRAELDRRGMLIQLADETQEHLLATKKALKQKRSDEAKNIKERLKLQIDQLTESKIALYESVIGPSVIEDLFTNRTRPLSVKMKLTSLKRLYAAAKSAIDSHISNGPKITNGRGRTHRRARTRF